MVKEVIMIKVGQIVSYISGYHTSDALQNILILYMRNGELGISNESSGWIYFLASDGRCNQFYVPDSNIKIIRDVNE